MNNTRSGCGCPLSLALESLEDRILPASSTAVYVGAGALIAIGVLAESPAVIIAGAGLAAVTFGSQVFQAGYFNFLQRGIQNIFNSAPDPTALNSLRAAQTDASNVALGLEMINQENPIQSAQALLRNVAAATVAAYQAVDQVALDSLSGSAPLLLGSLFPQVNFSGFGFTPGVGSSTNSGAGNGVQLTLEQVGLYL